MAEAYTGDNRTSYKYQFSPLPATHGSDLQGYFGPLGGVPYLGVDFQRAFMSECQQQSPAVITSTDMSTAIWGNFITQGDPSISDSIAAGSSSNATTGTNAASEWPVFSVAEPYQLDLNQTGGTPAVGSSELFSPVNTTYFTGPGLMNNFTLANAYTWEDGRGVRCDFWRGVASLVPE
jgi:hypothetical protein